MRFQIGEFKQFRSKFVKNVIEEKALLELLIDKGIISQEEYNKKVDELKERARKNNPDLDLT